MRNPLFCSQRLLLGASIRSMILEREKQDATGGADSMITKHAVHARGEARNRRMLVSLLAGLLFALLVTQAIGASFERFFGYYQGQSDTIPEGESVKRKMTVEIKPSDAGFTVSWHTTITKAGRSKTKGLSVDFTPTSRSNTYASAMRTDMFGHPVPLDLMKGEPLLWATINGETMTVYLIRILDDGSQDLQIDRRTRTPDGLRSEFIGLYDGEPLRRIGATLKKVDIMMQ
jgi:hypothetical protein